MYSEESIIYSCEQCDKRVEIPCDKIWGSAHPRLQCFNCKQLICVDCVGERCIFDNVICKKCIEKHDRKNIRRPLE